MQRFRCRGICTIADRTRKKGNFVATCYGKRTSDSISSCADLMIQDAEDCKPKSEIRSKDEPKCFSNQD